MRKLNHYCKWVEPKTPGLKDLRIKIEQYLNSNVRAEKIFYNPHMPISIKNEMAHNEWQAIKDCIWSENSPFRTEVDKLCPTIDDKRGFESAIQRKTELWHSTVTIGVPGPWPGYRDFEKIWSDLERHEADVGNTDRVKILQELKAEHNLVKHSISYEIKQLTQMHNYGPIEEYFKTDNPKEVNKELLDKALNAIETIAAKYEKEITNKELIYDTEITPEGFRQIKETEKKRERLWDKLRTEGPNFSPENMKKLAQLERSPFNLRSNMIGIIELGRINKEYGIIKEGADKIFPEYAQLCEYLQRQEIEIQDRSLKQWDDLAHSLDNISDRLINKEKETVNKAFEEKLPAITDRGRE